MQTDRRSFLTSATMGALTVACAGRSGSAAHAGGPEPKAKPDEEVTPAEDLMREHGVLRRVMYLYDEAALRLEARRDTPLDAVAGGAGIIRRVLEDYHEKLEENFLFPRFEQAGKLVELIAILRRQHQVGRVLTEQITALAQGKPADADRAKLADVMRQFNHMYRAHAAREDTVLFPEIRAIVGAKAYDEMGDMFEAKEREMLGEDGFEHAVAEVARLEQAFGIADLAKLTPVLAP